MRALRLLLVIAAAWGVGCVTYDRGSFAAVSTAIVPIEMTAVEEEVEGRACGAVFQDPLKRAIDDAVQKIPGANALIDLSYHFEQLCIVVRATPVRVP
jgi:hypothetical protein